MTAGCVVATEFRFQGAAIHADIHGLSHAAKQAMEAKFPSAITSDGTPGVFYMSLVPNGTPQIDLD
jgi:hypothetical protein